MIHPTGKYLTIDQEAEVKRLLSPKLSMDLDTNITITTPGDKQAAWKLLDTYAVLLGLDRLPGGQHYGLASNREIVRADR